MAATTTQLIRASAGRGGARVLRLAMAPVERSGADLVKISCLNLRRLRQAPIETRAHFTFDLGSIGLTCAHWAGERTRWSKMSSWRYQLSYLLAQLAEPFRGPTPNLAPSLPSFARKQAQRAALAGTRFSANEQTC